MAGTTKPPVVLGSTAATRRQWRYLLAATTGLSMLNCLLFYLISGQPDAILPGCVAVVLGAGGQALVWAERAFAGIESRWALSSRRESAVLFGARFRSNVRLLSLYERLGGTGVVVRGASALLVGGLLLFVLVQDFHVGFAAILLMLALACAILPELFWGAILLGAGMLIAAAHQRFGTTAWPTLFILAAAGSEILFFVWLQANLQEQVRFANEIPARNVALQPRAWLSSAVLFVLLMVIVFAFCKPHPRFPRPATSEPAELVPRAAEQVSPAQTQPRPGTGGSAPGGGAGQAQGGAGRDLSVDVCRRLPWLCSSASRGSGGGVGQGEGLAAGVCRLLPFLCEGQGSGLGQLLAGGGKDASPAPNGAPGALPVEGSRDAPPGQRHQALDELPPQQPWPPLPPGEGRGEGPKAPGKAPHPSPFPEGEGKEGSGPQQLDKVLGRGTGQDRAPGSGGSAGAGQGRGLGHEPGEGLSRGSGAGGGWQGGVSQGGRLAGNDEGKAGERAGMPTRGRPVLPEQPPDQTQPVPPPELEWPELKLDYQKIGLAIVVLLVLVVGAYLWLRRKRQDEKTDREHDQDNAKLSPDQVRRAINRFRQQCQELLDTPIQDESYAREKVIELYNSLLEHFAECGVGKPPSFTPDEYCSKETTGRPTLRDELSHVTTTFNRALYGLLAPPPDEFRMYIRNVARLGGFVTLY